MWWSTPEWQHRRNAKIAERDERLAAGKTLVASHPVATHLADRIVSSTASELVQGIEKRQWTATDLLSVFVARTLLIQAEFNPVTEVLFGTAWKEAQELDQGFEKTGKLVGPLHGVPCSFKDQYHITGYDSTIGFTHATCSPAKSDASFVKIIRQAGGIPFCKSNVPQTMLSFECANPLFGITSNPYNPARVPGGSTGGDAVLLASDASPLGFGSDIGGSLRIPAAFSGCFGLKPCYGRLPAGGARGSNNGFEAVRGCLGPMGRSVDDLETAMKVLLGSIEDYSRIEPVIPLPWRKVELKKTLKFGYYLTDGFCRASPAMRRAVLETVEALRLKGHDCVEIQLPDAVRAMELFVALSSSDCYKTLLSGLEGDPQEASLWLTTFGPKLPFFLRQFASYLVRNWVGDHPFASLLGASRQKSVGEMQSFQYQRTQFAETFRQKIWVDLALDGIICPSQATPALEHGQTWDLSPLAISTIIWNVVESSAGVIPVTFVDAEKDAVTEDFMRQGEPGSKIIEAKVYGPGGAYDAKKMAGLPVGVQIVGAYFEEEKVLAMMRLADEALGPRGFGPGEYAKRSIS